MTDKQIEEKVRAVLRRSERYHAEKTDRKERPLLYESTNEVHLYIVADRTGAHGFDKKGFQYICILRLILTRLSQYWEISPTILLKALKGVCSQRNAAKRD